MFVIEFRTKIKDGTIEIPKKHRKKVKNKVRVVIYSEENKVEADIIQRLFDMPIKLKKFKPLSRDKIYERS